MLTLPIKKKWFDMILSGEKKEEYREIKPYYISRIFNEMGIQINSKTAKMLLSGQEYQVPDFVFDVMFRNGYSKNSPSFIAKCTLSVGTGKEEWGAEKGKQYFILTIKEILKGK